MTDISKPREEFYVREDKNDPLFGPLNFAHADYYARKLSRENVLGLAEMVTLVGANDRAGDPVKTPSKLFVVFVYRRGRKLLGGRTANLHSELQIPPAP